MLTRILTQRSNLFVVKRALPLSGHQMRFFAVAKLEKFDYKDPLKFDGLLTDEEKMIEQSAKQFAQEKLLPRVVKAYKDEHFDVEIMREMGEMGFLGCTIDEYDLPGVSSVAYGKSFI